jgi:eukaryotic-like serine/threonine-protein kinase
MSPQEQLFRSGDRCGPYEIHSFLARGGMGEVYLGTHAFNGRKAAIKVLQLSHTGDAKAMARIRQEALFLCKLNHPNIVTTYDSNIAEDGTIWIAMERLQARVDHPRHGERRDARGRSRARARRHPP